MVNVMEGVRILEVAEHAFVPASAAILSDWGAEVIKVEHVERGDAMRGLMTSGIAGFGMKVPVLLEHANRGKKSIGLDLTDPEGLEILYQLAARSDVFLTNKLPEVCKKLSIEVEQIRAHNPSIIYVRGSGYGPVGPDADAGGYDVLGFWARAGTAESITPSDVTTSRIPPPGPAYGDNIGSMTLAGGISAALFHRERTGEGTVVDVSLLGAGMWAMGGSIAVSQLMEIPWTTGPTGGVGTPFNPLIGMYRTADDRFIALSMLQGFPYWAEFCERLDRQDLIADERFADVEAFMGHGVEGSQIVADELAKHTLAELRERFDGMHGQWAAVQNTLEIRDDEMVQANGYLQTVETAEGVPFQLVAAPVQFDGESGQPERSPMFHEQGDAILADDLGIDWDRIVELKTKGVVA